MNDHRRTIQTLFVSNLVLSFGFQIWRAVFNNLAAGMGLEAGAVGVVQLALSRDQSQAEGNAPNARTVT